MNVLTKALHDLDRCQARYRAGYMAQFGLKGRHANYLMALWEEPGISQDRLAKKLYADKSNIARQIAFLEEQGYVRRETDAGDKRVLHVYPTDKAAALLPLILEKQGEWDSFVTRDLTGGEVAQARELLQKMKRRADQFLGRDA